MIGLIHMLICAAFVVTGAAYGVNYAQSRMDCVKAFALVAFGLGLFCYFI